MIDSQSGTQTPSPHSKRIPIQERAALAGNIIVINGYRVDRVALVERFSEGGYRVQRTSHFLLFTRSQEPSTILVHLFAPEAINVDIGTYLVEELQPLGVLHTADLFGQMLTGIIFSMFPQDKHRSFYFYIMNSLQEYRTLLNTGQSDILPPSNLRAFSAWYRRICQIPLGKSFLDAGCLLGLLTFLIAERIPTLEHIVGVDIQADNFPTMRTIAVEQHLNNIQFMHADLVNIDDMKILGKFDTVVALGVIEHFSEEEMYRVLANLLALTVERLIIAVPYEPVQQAIYGHQQLFTRAKLEAVGQWCTEHWGRNTRCKCEDCEGGLLIIERLAL